MNIIEKPDIIRGTEGTYIGRILGVGLTEDGRPAAVYGISGRSQSSKQRRLILSDYILGPEVLVEPVGEMTEEQTSRKAIYFYPAIRALNPKEGRKFRTFAVFSNGAHTAEIFGAYTADSLRNSQIYAPTLQEILNMWGPEKDSLGTPRIAGVCFNIDYILGMVSSRENRLWCNPLVNSDRGKIYYIHTYGGDPDIPRAADLKEPAHRRLKSNEPIDIAELLFDSIDPAYVVATAAAVRDENGLWRMAVRNSIE